MERTVEETGVTRLDLVGLRCPLPVLKSRRALAGLAPGARLEVVTSDPLASIDLPNMCREDGHRLVSMETDGGRARFLIECGGAQEKPPEKPEI
jgi:tRNA 2-thiouridine synthesizing protein A